MNNKFYNIYNEFAKTIEEGSLKPNTKLPSEKELTEKYNVSRETVRKALNLLSQNGYIQKIKGKGSFVLDVAKFDFPVTGIVSFKEISQKLGKKSNTIVEELELITPNAFLQTQMDAGENDNVWKVVRVREIGNERIILDKDFFLESCVPNLTKDICENSIYEYIENELFINISFDKKVISVEKATNEDKKYLDLGDDTVVVVVKNYVSLNDTTVFQYTESRHKIDKFKFIHFARRN